MGVSQRGTGLASNHQLVASSVSWDRDRLGRRVTSEPIGFNIWAIAFRRAAELGSPSCNCHGGELARLPNHRSRNL